MTLYEFLVFVHVLMVVVWVGGDVAIQALALRATRAKEPARMAAFSADAEWIGLRVFMPASIVVVIVGIWAAIEGDWDFGQAWISIGFAASCSRSSLEWRFWAPSQGGSRPWSRNAAWITPRLRGVPAGSCCSVGSSC